MRLIVKVLKLTYIIAIINLRVPTSIHLQATSYTSLEILVKDLGWTEQRARAALVGPQFPHLSPLPIVLMCRIILWGRVWHGWINRATVALFCTGSQASFLMDPKHLVADIHHMHTHTTQLQICVEIITVR